MKKLFLFLVFVACLFICSCGENETNCNHYGWGGDYWDTPLYNCHCPGSPKEIHRRCGVITNKRYKYADKNYESQVERYQQNEQK